jgi:hypothetical protein
VEVECGCVRGERALILAPLRRQGRDNGIL